MSDEDIRWWNEHLTWPMVLAIPVAILFVGALLASIMGFVFDVLRMLLA